MIKLSVRPVACSLVLLVGSLSVGRAQEEAVAPPASGNTAIAATVNGDPIPVGLVDAVLANSLKNRQAKPSDLNKTKANLLRELIKRKVVEQALIRDDKYVAQATIDKEINKLKNMAQTQRLTLDQFMARRGVALAAVREEIIWKVGWNRYLEINLAEGLENYFNEHRRDFDGTQLHMAHIVLRPNRFNETNDSLTAQAKKIRADIQAGKITFEQAAQRYSAGPSRHKGGDLGLVPRYGMMVEDFSKAAFALEKGEISEPVVTPFGVHLIRYTDAKPGTRQWTEVIPQIKQVAALSLYEKLAQEELATAKVEYTGLAPYFKPGTDDEVVVPPPAKDKKPPTP